MKVVKPVSCYIFLVLIVSGVFFNLHTSDVPDEITLSYNSNNPPYKFTNKDGHPDGLLINIWKLWAKKTGIPIKFIADGFEQTVADVKDGKTDVHAGIFFTEERAKELEFSIPLLDVEYFIFAEKSVYRNDFKINELSAFRIGVPEGYTAEYAIKNFPESNIEVFPDYPELYKACEENSVKIFISPKENLEYYLETAQSENHFRILFSKPLFKQSYLGAVKRGSSELLSKINRGFEYITTEEKDELQNTWFGEVKKFYSFEGNGKFEYSEKERIWLAEHREILISGDPEWPPNSMYDSQGNYIGIIPDFWSLIEKKSGLKLNRIKSSSWGQTIEMLKSGEIQIIDCVSETAERSEFMDFTGVLFTSHTVLVGRDELDYVNGLNDIGNLTLAVLEGTSDVSLIKRDYPDIEMIFYSDINSAYLDVASGKIDLFIRHQSEFMYNKREKMLTNLKIVGPTGFSRQYKIGVRKGDTELLSILNRALSKITQEEKTKIFDKWHGSEKTVIDYTLVWKIVISSLLLLIVIIYWNRKLSKEISLRKKIQDELQIAMEKAESATKAKSEFLANMSHEIRTPMNAILGFADLMKKTPLTTLQESYLATIKSGGATLLNIINDILDLSKIEANKLDINYDYFDLTTMIFDLSQFFNEKLRSKNVELIISADEKMPRTVYLDELRIRQIFFNLLSNAIKFTNKGSIRIDTSFTERNNGNIDLKIVVSDTGIGIRQEDQQKIFDAFEQVSDTETVKKFQGTGLGLTITKRLTELMNGHITLESEVGKGSKFIIEFADVKYDKKDSLKNNRKPSEIEKIRFRESKILIADDIESNRLLLIEFCKELGLETIEAVNGKEAVEYAKLNVPDMILMDMRMPVMDGYEAIKIIKYDESLKKIPVIAVTASVMSSDKAKIAQHKFDGYIRKPVSVEELTSEMKKYLKYDVIKNNLTEFKPEEEIIIDGDKLFAILSGEMLQKVEKAESSHNFSQIKELASNLKELAEKHKANRLGMFAVKLYDSVIRFDIESIKILLDNYNDLILALKKEMEAGNE
ncbi:MAG: hypothetical protein A2Y39_07145 [Candidatus Delongbacteria bacterium GWF2_40_14]|nr:MAG: hypothetical protein A2Y39_07145 [Candidatus Delongbacteria bacterium GWF2_40_14]